MKRISFIIVVWLTTLSINADSIINPFITSSLSSIDATTIEKNSLTQIEQALNGTLSGLYSIRNNGMQFGTKSYNLFVRGKATTADNSPLILVDGVDADINLLDPAEIERITVLKDASELVMYGLRGANGVILIETKNGKAGFNTMKVNVQGGFQNPANIPSQLNAFQYTTLHNEANFNDGANQIYQADKYLNSSDIYRYPNNNFSNSFLKNATYYTHYDFNASGGNDIAQYYALISYTRQNALFTLPSDEDFLKKTYNERYNFRTNLKVDLGKGFEINTFINAVFDDRRSPWINSSQTVNNSMNYVFDVIMNTPAHAFPLRNPDGSLGGTSEYRDNPIGILSAGQRIENTRKLSANVLLKKDLSELLKGLDLFARYSFENYNAYYKANYNTFAVYQLNDDETYNTYGVDDTKVSTAGGQMSGYFSNNNFQAGAEFNRVFDNHQLYASTAFDQHVSHVGADNPPYKWLGTSAKILYGFDRRYFVQFTGSHHGSNNYLSEKRYGFFPAGSLAWVISEESFLESVKGIDYLKFKTSAGTTGNDKTGGSRFMYRQAFFNGNGYGFGNPNGTSQGSYEGVLNNPDATWERALKFNVGAETQLLNKKLSINADYFFEKRNSILINQGNLTPSLIGISLPQFNAGVVQNQGFESDINYGDKIGQLKFNIGLNLLYAKNKIVDFKELNYPDNESYRYRKGNPVNSIFGLVADGIYKDEAEIQAHNVVSSYGQIKPGDIKYIDQNNDGIINDADRKAIGNAFPEFIYGLNIGLEYKGFDITAFAEGSEMFDIHARPNQFSTYAYENRWSQTNSSETASYPRLSFVSKHNEQTSSYWIEKGSLFRVSAIELGYSLPNQIVNKLKLSDLRVYLKLHDAINTVTKLEKRDMEVPEAGYTMYPVMKTSLLGVTIKL